MSVQAGVIHADEADVLNVAMFGVPAKQWQETNSDLKGNIANLNAIHYKNVYGGCSLIHLTKKW